MIAAVFFDLGGTLIESPELARCLEILETLDVSVDADEFVHRHREALLSYDLSGAPAPDAPEFWKSLLQSLLGRPVGERVVNDFLHRYEGVEPSANLYSDVRRCLSSLSVGDKTLGVISNSRSEQHVRSLLERAGLDGTFATVVSSGTERVSKPDPAIFHRAAARLGVPLRSCVHVGDLPNTDARGAESAGFHGVWLNRAGTGLGEDPPEISSLLELPGWIEQLERRSR